MEKRRPKARRPSDAPDPFLDLVHQLYSADTWNLSFLSLKGRLNEPHGRMVRRQLDLDEISGLASLSSANLLMLDSKAKFLFTVNLADLDEIHPEARWTWTSVTPTQVAALESFVYVLVPENGRVEVLQFAANSTGFRVIPLEPLEIREYTLTSDTRMVALPLGQRRLLFLGPDVENRLLQVDLETRQCTVSTLSTPDGHPITLGSTFCLGTDVNRGSIILGDSLNHRILEVDVQTAKSSLLLGCGEGGYSTEQEQPATAKITGPAAVTVHAPLSHINQGFLSRRSLQILETNILSGRPRSIIFFDPAQRAIKRLLELPDDLALLSYRGHRAVYTLLGVPLVKGFTPRLDPLLYVNHLDISHLVVASTGDLIATIPPASLCVLQPATARSSSIVAQEANQHTIVDT